MSETQPERVALDDIFRNRLCKALETRGWEAHPAGDGAAALELATRCGPDLTVVDLRLPELDGRRMWDWIVRERPVLAPRVLFMTGDMLSSEIEQFVNGTGRPVLAKPVTVAQVRAAVQAVLATRAPAPPKLAPAPTSQCCT